MSAASRVDQRTDRSPESILHHSGRIVCIGCSHRTAPIGLREKFFVEAHLVSESLIRLKRDFGLEGLFILSTCNRFEIFVHVPADGPSGEALAGEVLTAKAIELYLQANPRLSAEEREELRRNTSQSLYVLRAEAAIAHAFHVASSVDSLVVGETQITAQFKQAIELSRQAACLGGILDRLAQDALATAKQVRSKTDISKHPLSISHAAIDLAGKILEDLHTRQVLVVGAGEMAEICCKYLKRFGPSQIWVANRTLANAQKLVESIGQGIAVPLTQIPMLLREVDVVISSTAAPGYVVRLEEIRHAWPPRAGRAMVLVDIALPRDIDPRIDGTFDDIYLFDIDDLEGIVEENSEKRNLAKLKAMDIIQGRVRHFQDWLGHIPTKETLGEIRSRLLDFFQSQWRESRESGNLKGLTLKADELRIVEDSVQGILQRLVNELGARLKKESEDPAEFSSKLESLRGLFRFTGQDRFTSQETAQGNTKAMPNTNKSRGGGDEA